MVAVAIVGTAVFVVVLGLGVSQLYPEFWQMVEAPLRIVTGKALGFLGNVDAFRSEYPTGYSITTQVLGWVVAGVVFAWRRLRRLLRFKTPLEHFFLDQQHIHIVFPSIRGVSFSPENNVVKGPIVLPKNAPLLPLGDALGVNAIAAFVQSQFRRGQVVVPHYGESANIPGDQRFLTIGGPSVNEVTRRFMDRIGVHGPQFYDSQNGGKGQEFRPEHESEDIGSNIVIDYGFIINSAISHNTRQRVLLILGCWPQGTLGAARVIIGQLSSNKNYSDLRKRFKSQKDLLAIVRCTAFGLVEDHVEIVRIGPIGRAEIMA